MVNKIYQNTEFNIAHHICFRRAKTWLENVKRYDLLKQLKDGVKSKHIYMCEDHFEKTMICKKMQVLSTADHNIYLETEKKTSR